MRPPPNALIAAYRQRVPGYENTGAGNNGLFLVPCGSVRLAVIASDQESWDHVSVSLPDRTPTWAEMDHVKNLFFCDSEAVMQLHPPRERWVNCHNFCLHLWRCQNVAIPLPPSWMVGDKNLSYEEMARLTPKELQRQITKLEQARRQV